MRSQGQVRFITITSRMQMAAVGLVAVLLGAWGVSLAAMAVRQYQASSLLEREAEVATAESRVAAYRDDIDDVTEDLKRRQDFIEDALPMLPDDIQPSETVSNSRSEADETVAKISAVMPEAAALARIEARQLAFVENLTRYADRRAEAAGKALRRLGLNPDR